MVQCQPSVCFLSLFHAHCLQKFCFQMRLAEGNNTAIRVNIMSKNSAANFFFPKYDRSDWFHFLKVITTSRKICLLKYQGMERLLQSIVMLQNEFFSPYWWFSSWYQLLVWRTGRRLSMLFSHTQKAEVDLFWSRVPMAVQFDHYWFGCNSKYRRKWKGEV